MGANTKLASMPDKLPDINHSNRGFHGFGGSLQRPQEANQLNIEDVEINFETNKQDLPEIQKGGIVTNQLQLHGPTESKKTSQQRIFLTCVDEDEEIAVGEAIKVPHNDKYCGNCAEKVAMETGKLTEKIIEFRLEGDRQQIQIATLRRKLENTCKQLKTAQAVIETLKDQNHEKANRIANLTREATIGLWNREKKKLLQFADVKEASLEYELQLLKDSSQNFKDRAMDRIQFLHDQVYRLKLKLKMQSAHNHVNKILDDAERKLATTRQELDTQKDEFFKFRRNMVGMLSGFHKDFRFLQDQVDPETYATNANFFDHAESFERMLGDLQKAALTDNLRDAVETLPDQFSMTESQKNDMINRNQKRERERKTVDYSEQDITLSRHNSLSDADMLKTLENIEAALQQSSRELRDFDEKTPELLLDKNDINDSGISLNDYEGMSTSRANSDAARDTPTSSGYHNSRRDTIDKTVRFEGIESDPQKIGTDWRGRRDVRDPQTTEKSVQTDILPQITSPLPSRNGKRNRKGKSRSARSGSSTPTSKKKPPKKIDVKARTKQEQALQKQWFAEVQKNDIEDSSPKEKKRGAMPDSKSRQNNTVTFRHLRDMYGEKRVSNLIDRTTGAVDVEMAEQQFSNLSRAGILEGFNHFVQSDTNNDYRLDMNEVVRAISRATDEVVEHEEIKAALFELGVMETDELDFFDFLCIQETLTTGTFDKSKSEMLRMQETNAGKKNTVSKYCIVM